MQCACMYNCTIFKTEKTKLTKASAAGALSNISPLDTYIWYDHNFITSSTLKYCMHVDCKHVRIYLFSRSS